MSFLGSLPTRLLILCKLDGSSARPVFDSFQTGKIYSGRLNISGLTFIDGGFMLVDKSDALEPASASERLIFTLNLEEYSQTVISSILKLSILEPLGLALTVTSVLEISIP